MTSFSVVALPDQTFQFKNEVLMNPLDVSNTCAIECISCEGKVYLVRPSHSTPKGHMALNKIQRRQLRQEITATPVELTKIPPVYIVTYQLSLVNDKIKNSQIPDLSAKEIGKMFLQSRFMFPTSCGQEYVLDTTPPCIFKVVALFDLNKSPLTRGNIMAPTQFVDAENEDDIDEVSLGIPFTSQPKKFQPIFKGEIDLKKMNIGGLGEQFEMMFRRAFASRSIHPSIVKRLGIKHVKGMLLYGPPGCGKTLIARKLCECLNTVPPKIVNGPELLDKYHGESERKIRDLFSAAESDQKSLGDSSPLHVIIFDEFDSIASRRSGGENNLGDKIVNQLLTKIDGTDVLNNILIIAMTNRKDMIDDAILRPGRLEIHIEITLPDEDGRFEILEIHTASLRANKNIGQDVSLGDLAKQTKNYTGAEIEGMVNNARSFALSRAVDISKLNDKTKSQEINGDDIVVTRSDFNRAIDETKAAFGSGTVCELRKMVPPADVFKMDERVQTPLVDFFSLSTKTKMTMLICGARESGKTSQAVGCALSTEIPCIKYVHPYNFSGEFSVIHGFKKNVRDASITEKSIVIIDDYETLVEWSPCGPRFSNAIVQTINATFKNHFDQKIAFIVTCDSIEMMEMLDVKKLFDVVVEL